MNDDEIIARGGTQDDIDRYAESYGMTSPQEDDELMRQIVRAAPYSDIPNEANCQELFRLIKARDEQREPSRAEKVNYAAELLVEWAKQEDTEHLDLPRFKAWLKDTLTKPQQQDKEEE